MATFARRGRHRYPNFARAFSNSFHLAEGEQVGSDLRVVAEIALLGILHYVGRTIRHCAESGRGFQRIDNARVSVCLGGRASNLYRALFGRGDQRSHLSGSLNVFADAAAGLIVGATDVYSDDPKHEVAYGLLVEQRGAQNLDLEQYRVREVILGEKIRMGDAVLEANAVTSDLDIRSAWRADTLEELETFLESVRRHSDISVRLTPENEKQIIDSINQQLAEDHDEFQRLSAERNPDDPRLRSESTVIEPPFIVALRELITLVIDGNVAARTLA